MFVGVVRVGIVAVIVTAYLLSNGFDRKDSSTLLGQLGPCLGMRVIHGEVGHYDWDWKSYC